MNVPTRLCAFLIKYTGGRCGSYKLLDDAVVAEFQVGKTTVDDVQRILGQHGWIRVKPRRGIISLG